jgi:hypothetical protein
MSNNTQLNRRIGSTSYIVTVHTSDTATETIEEKMIRLIRHEALDFSGGCGIIGSPQMSRQSERSA